MKAEEFAAHAELEDHHWWFVVRRQLILDQLLRGCPPEQADLMVEIGCGTGGNLRQLGHHYRTLGVDSSVDAVQLAQKLDSGEVLLGDFRDQLASRWLAVSAILLADVLEHVEDDAKFLRDCTLPLNPGAQVVITVPASHIPMGPHDLALGHYRRYTKASLSQLWRDLPLKLERSSYFNTVLFPLIWAARKLSSDDGNTDLKAHSQPINAILRTLFGLERTLLQQLSLPFGASLLAVLRRTD